MQCDRYAQVVSIHGGEHGTAVGIGQTNLYKECVDISRQQKTEAEGAAWKTT